MLVCETKGLSYEVIDEIEEAIAELRAQQRYKNVQYSNPNSQRVRESVQPRPQAVINSMNAGQVSRPPKVGREVLNRFNTI